MISASAKLGQDMWNDCSRPRREQEAKAQELVLVKCPRVVSAYAIDVAVVYDEAAGL